MIDIHFFDLHEFVKNSCHKNDSKICSENFSVSCFSESTILDLKLAISGWAKIHNCDKVCFWGSLIAPAFDCTFSFSKADSVQVLSLKEFTDSDLKNLKIPLDPQFATSTILLAETFHNKVSLVFPPFIINLGEGPTLWILTSLSSHEGAQFSSLEILKHSRDLFSESLKRLLCLGTAGTSSQKTPPNPVFEIILEKASDTLYESETILLKIQKQIDLVLNKISQIYQKSDFSYSIGQNEANARLLKLNLKSSDAVIVSAIYEFVRAYLPCIESCSAENLSKNTQLSRFDFHAFHNFKTKLLIHAPGYLSSQRDFSSEILFLAANSSFFISVKSSILKLLKASGFLLMPKNFSYWICKGLNVFQTSKNEFLQWLDDLGPSSNMLGNAFDKNNDSFLMLNNGCVSLDVFTAKGASPMFLALLISGWSHSLNLWMDEYQNACCQSQNSDLIISAEECTKKYLRRFGINSVVDLITSRNVSELLAVFEDFSSISYQEDLFFFDFYQVYRLSLLDAHASMYRNLLERSLNQISGDVGESTRSRKVMANNQKCQVFDEIQSFLEQSKGLKSEAFVFACLKLMPKVWQKVQLL